MHANQLARFENQNLSAWERKLILRRIGGHEPRGRQRLGKFHGLLAAWILTLHSFLDCPIPKVTSSPTSPSPVVSHHMFERTNTGALCRAVFPPAAAAARLSMLRESLDCIVLNVGCNAASWTSHLMTIAAEALLGQCNRCLSRLECSCMQLREV